MCAWVSKLIGGFQARTDLLTQAMVVLFPLLWWEKEAVKQMETSYGKEATFDFV